MKFYSTSHRDHYKPEKLVFLLHGWGANGEDLLSIAEEWQRDMPDVLFICPEAPQICDQNPLGFQWFSLNDWSQRAMEEGAAQAYQSLHLFLHEQMKAHDLAPKDCALMGFSQGMMMAVYTGLRQDKPFAGILGYSGALIRGNEEKINFAKKSPFCLIHGIADPVVPVALHDQAAAWLRQNQFHIETLKIPGLPHGIDREGLAKGRKFLTSCLKI